MKITRNGMGIMRNALLVTSICFIIIGLQRGEAATVLKKAIKICLECIGVG